MARVPPRIVDADDPLHIFIIPHSYNDPGWLKTVQGYFESETQHILDTIVQALAADPRRKFIWAEIGFFSLWWDSPATTDEQRALTITLLENGQLEFVTGGWVMTDEANPLMEGMHWQVEEGHTWIRENLGPQFIPQYGWSIDPFGYSPTMPFLLKSRHNFTAILIQRVHYNIKAELARLRGLEFMWRQNWDTNGTYDTFTHLMPYVSYNIPDTCGPNLTVCCQFDFARHPMGPYGPCRDSPPVPVTDDNVAERAHALLDQYLRKASLYRGNAVLIPLGDDFRYQTPQEAEHQFGNYQKLFDYINANVPGVQIQFGTLSEYFRTVMGTFTPPTLQGSFFTYADRAQDYWSGYFTSRVFDKALSRDLERALFAAQAVDNNSSAVLRGPRQQLGIFHHHDAVTGTAKTFVVEDYALRLYQALHETEDFVQKAVAERLRRSNHPIRDAALEACWQADAPRARTEFRCRDTAVAFNPLPDIDQFCGEQRVGPLQVQPVALPCETSGPPLPHYQETTETNHHPLVVDPATGWLVSPVREDWMVWHVRQGGAYLFFPDHETRYEKHLDTTPPGGYVVRSENWSRTIVQHPSPPGSCDASIVDFIYEFHLQDDNQEWFVRFSADVASGGVFYTDLNGFNLEAHYRKAFDDGHPVQSQVYPMPTHAALQDEKRRLTVLSQHAQGAASLQDGSLDIFLDRRLAQDDSRGLGQGVQDNAPVRSRFRVIVEDRNCPATTKMTTDETSGEQSTTTSPLRRPPGIGTDSESFRLSDLVWEEWQKLNHPLELFGTVKQSSGGQAEEMA